MDEHKTNDAVLLEKIEQLGKEVEALREEVKPFLDAYNAIEKTSTFVVWLSKLIVAVGIIIGLIIGSKHFN